MKREIYGSWIGGVCGGLANYIGMNTSLLRVLTVISALFSFGWTILIYLIMWLIIPSE